MLSREVNLNIQLSKLTEASCVDLLQKLNDIISDASPAGSNPSTENTSYIADFTKIRVHKLLRKLQTFFDHKGSDTYETDKRQRVEEVLEQLASCPETPPALLELLCLVGSPGTIERVAEHSNASPGLLNMLSDHTSCEVRIAVAEHQSTPIKAVWKLAEDNCLDIPYRLAENPFTPYEVLEWLTECDNPFVQDRALRTIKRKHAISHRAD